MYFKDNMTMFQQAIKATQNDFVDNLDPNKMFDMPNNFLFKGAPLIRVGSKTEAIKELLNIEHLMVENRYKLSGIKSDKLFKNVTKDIVNINDINGLKEAINLINDIKQELGNKFYGALLVSDKIILNPFHLVTAMLLLDENKYREYYNRRWRIVIYTFDEENIDDVKAQYNYEANEDIIDRSLNALIKVASHQIKTNVNIIESEANGDQLRIKYKINKTDIEDPDYELYLSAHQILTDGIVIPYYGSSIIKMNGYTTGRHVSPMCSCNIAEPIRDTRNEILDKDKWRNVCTGSLNNQSLKGLRTLNHANLQSAYFKNIMYNGALLYAEKMIEKSIEIYKTAGVINEQE